MHSGDSREFPRSGRVTIRHFVAGSSRGSERFNSHTEISCFSAYNAYFSTGTTTFWRGRPATRERDGGSPMEEGAGGIQKSVIWRYVFRENCSRSIIFSAQIRRIHVFFSKSGSVHEGEKDAPLVRFQIFLRIKYSLGNS